MEEEIERRHSDSSRLAVLESQISGLANESVRVRNTISTLNNHLHEIKGTLEQGTSSRNELIRTVDVIDEKLNELLEIRRTHKNVIKILTKTASVFTIILGGFASFFYWAWDHIGINHLFGFK